MNFFRGTSNQGTPVETQSAWTREAPTEKCFLRKTENKIKLEWVNPKDGKIPENGFSVKDSRNVSQFIAIDQDTNGAPIVQAIFSDENISDVLQILVADERDFDWKPMQKNGHLPCGAVRAVKGVNGNIYIGKSHGNGCIGTITMPNGKESWTFNEDGKDVEGASEPFLVLCKVKEAPLPGYVRNSMPE